jgi:hypothetical protein
LLRATTGTLLTTVLNNVVGIVGGASASTLFNAISGNPVAGFGSFVGKYLANEILKPENQAGAIGGSIGSALGSIIGSSTVVIGSVAASLGISTHGLRVAPPIMFGSRRALRLIERNLNVYRHTWIVIVSGFFEPLFYLLGIGFGLGALFELVLELSPSMLSVASGSEF